MLYQRGFSGEYPLIEVGLFEFNSVDGYRVRDYRFIFGVEVQTSVGAICKRNTIHNAPRLAFGDTGSDEEFDDGPATCDYGGLCNVFIGVESVHWITFRSR